MKPSIMLIALAFTSFLMTSFTTATGGDEKLVRKRRANGKLARPLGHNKFELDFGRIVEGVFKESSYDLSLSYSFLYPELSYSYPSKNPTSKPTQIVPTKPSRSPTNAPNLSSAPASPTESPISTEPTESPTVLPSTTVTPTVAPTAPATVTVLPTTAPTSTVLPTIVPTSTVLPTTLPTSTVSPTAPAIAPGTDSENGGNNNVVNNNANDIVVNGNEDPETRTASAIIVPFVGVVTGAFIIGAAIHAIDRRNGPTAYQNMDGDSQSSFSLDA